MAAKLNTTTNVISNPQKKAYNALSPYNGLGNEDTTSIWNMSSTPTPYKPSPLSFNSPRTSPFRRPKSPLAPSPSTVRATTPTSSPLKPSTPSNLSPEKTSQTPLRHATTSASSDPPPAWLTTHGTTTTPEVPTSPTRSGTAAPTVRPNYPTPSRASVTMSTNTHTPCRSSLTLATNGDPLTQIPPALLHSMRESFSVLDRSNAGAITAADVTDMLSQLGLDSSPSPLSSYFPSSQTMNLATYLHTLSALLAPLSQPSELNAAFAAFDDDDSGQIDLVELKDALLHTVPEAGDKRLTEREIERVVEGFSGRRAFGKGSRNMGGAGRGEVFRYGEFMAGVNGSGLGGENGKGVDGV